MSALEQAETGQDGVATRQRADLWLFRTRLFKSRSLAARFIEAGGVRLERFGRVQRLERASFNLQPGDVLVFVRGAAPEQIRVLGTGERRGPASEARTLYERLERTEARQSES